MILTGLDAARRKTAVIVELNQWTEAETTVEDAIVSAFLGGSVREVSQPADPDQLRDSAGEPDH